MNADITNMKYNIVRIWTDKSWLRYLQKQNFQYFDFQLLRECHYLVKHITEIFWINCLYVTEQKIFYKKLQIFL